MVRKGLILGFIVYLIFGAYFINLSFSFVNIPEFVLKFNDWIVLVGGILIVVGAVNYLRVSQRHRVIPAF